MSKKKNSKKRSAASAQTFRVESRTQRNRKLALWLLTSLVALLALYFGFIKAGEIIIQEIYIWSSFVLAVAYVFVAFFLALYKQKDENENSKKHCKLLQKLDKTRRVLLIIFIPMIVALLADIMLINLGLADFFGI